MGCETLLSKAHTVSWRTLPAASRVWAPLPGQGQHPWLSAAPARSPRPGSAHLGASGGRCGAPGDSQGRQTFAHFEPPPPPSLPELFSHPFLPPLPRRRWWPELRSRARQPRRDPGLAFPARALRSAIRPNICPSDHLCIHQCQGAAHRSGSRSRTTRALQCAPRTAPPCPAAWNSLKPKPLWRPFSRSTSFPIGTPNVISFAHHSRDSADAGPCHCGAVDRVWPAEMAGRRLPKAASSTL